MKKIRIALAQMAPGRETVPGNAQMILHYIHQAKEGGAELLLLPECSLCGYPSGGGPVQGIIPEDPLIRGIRKAAGKCSVAVCFGYVEREGDCLYITQELVSGDEIIRYRKTHLGTKEKKVFSEGSRFPVAQHPVRAGIQLCWESHIPEISAAEREKGAELLLVPYASPMTGKRCEENWIVHLPARASDNGAYVAACNLIIPAGEGSEERRGGGMAVWDPKGKRILSVFDTCDKIAFCDLEGPLPRECSGDMHHISYFDRKRAELFRTPD